jgi:hypothetical protein
MYLLAHSRNQAAVPVLIAALGSRRLEIRLGAIHGLAVRRNPEGHAVLLARMPDFGERDLAVLADSVLRSSHRMQQTLREALLADQLGLCESACRVILLGRVYQLLPALIEVSENQRHRHSAQALATVVQLARLLHEEMLARLKDRTCEPRLIRRQVLPALEQSVMRFETHKRLEIIDAFLLLVPPNNETLLRILNDRTNPSHQPIIDSLTTSAQVPILDLLTQLAHDTKAPQSALKIVAGRHDRKFVDYLLYNLRSPVPLRVLENFKRVSSVAWLNERRDTLVELDGGAQAAAVTIANVGAVGRATLLSLLEFLLKEGQPEGRRASCDALADFHERHVTQLVVGTLQDSDPRVQAAAVKQLRERRVPNAMERLIVLLDDPAPEVRDAARSSLSEFSFVRYRKSFDSMDQPSRTKMGALVAKVDLSTPQRLGELLGAPSVSTKLHALEMVSAMDAADSVIEQLAQLSTHADPTVRIATIETLGSCRHADPLPLLFEAELDPNLYVREAASRTVDEIADRTAGNPIFDAFLGEESP